MKICALPPAFRRGLRLAGLALLLCVAAWPQTGPDNPFHVAPVTVAPSPATQQRLPLPPGERIVDFDVARSGPRVAMLVRTATGVDQVRFWTIGAPAATLVWQAPAGLHLASIAWHPRKAALFLLAHDRSGSLVLRLDRSQATWRANTIFQDVRPLRRLVVAPRPFAPDDGKPSPYFRLFLGEDLADGHNRIISITATGKNLYQVIGPAATAPTEKQYDTPPDHLISSSALPVAFHPAGDRMIWEDGQRCLQVATYSGLAWGGSQPLEGGHLCGETATPTPNGLGLIEWRPGRPGVTVSLEAGRRLEPQAQNFLFHSTPSSTPDGRGIVGLVREGEREALVYIPIRVPLADVANAWMFAHSDPEIEHFREDGGLLRPAGIDQIYELYDSELYGCGAYGETTPARPYLVTTDALWEVFGAAFDGLFTVRERRQAIPAFWRFVDAAATELGQQSPRSRWAAVMATVKALRHSSAHPDPEVARILAAPGPAEQPQFGKIIDYGQLRPRGAYAGSPAMQSYFRAFRYLTAVAAIAPDLRALAHLSPATHALAMAWITPYRPFLAPPRGPLVWQPGTWQAASWVRHPLPRAELFPLAWGFDTEVMDETMDHSTWPAAERMTGLQGSRLLPSGLDVAAAMGSREARSLLAPEMQQYAHLGPVLDQLLNESRGALARPGNLYTGWLQALESQWRTPPPFPGLPSSQEALWNRKRLATGLASWSTLRHSTVLVNEETGAECGEGGFERLIAEPPRGYVEPDPAAFSAIAGLFDQAAGIIEADEQADEALPANRKQSTEDLLDGILRRLRSAAKSTREFQRMAEQEQQGQPLSNADYFKILYVGRVAEYNFKVFKSLMNPNYALSIPDPLPKAADVAGNAVTGYRMVGVGKALEWDQIVPWFGRREIVKGSVYSWQQTTAPEPMTDREWRQKLPAIPLPAWTQPYLVEEPLVCPAPSPY